ncbi:hypothetical protein CgunFtcFv8_009674 [Champsocephalus gunnari]|uniref:Uncharacterized protein n=1 Tax=Champsocephalus gunnari TaxID=52237 RepID=A0AAN8C3A1_CHAGU|nr:hypothetical protein CgunFtcFv8_009674 [Champsocephalus gunnari]
MEKKEDGAFWFFMPLPHLCSPAGRPQERGEIDRFIWIGKVDLSPPKNLFPSKPNDKRAYRFVVYNPGARNAPSARMMDLIIAGSLRYTIAASRYLAALRATERPLQYSM